MSVICVYVTAATADEAETIARTVVTDRLAACANVLPAVKSYYHWQGTLQESVEAVLILKTRDTLFPALAARVRELHSYETPCIVALPVSGGNAGFLDWVLAETKP